MTEPEKLKPRVMEPTGQASSGPQTHDEARQFYDGFISGLMTYARDMDHATSKLDNERLRRLIEKQGWKTVETYERVQSLPGPAVSLLESSRHAMYAAVGFIQGVSVASKESIVQWLVKQIKAIEDASRKEIP